MNITQEKTGNLNAVVKIKIAPADYSAKVEKAIKDQAKKAQLPGFRKGMVPPAHIKKMYGKSILVEEVNNLLNDTLSNYIAEQKIEILGQPLPQLENEREFKWDNTDEFEFDYELGLAPAFDVNVSSKDKYTEYVIKADEKTLEERAKNLRRSYGKMTNPEVSAEGDVLYAELVQLGADGSVFEGGIANSATLRLDLIKDSEILKTLIGLKKDDVVNINISKALDDVAGVAKALNISEEDAADLQSDFQLTVKNVNRLEESDLNQEFYDKIFPDGSVTDEATFKAKITEEVEGMFKQDAERKLSNDIYEDLLKKHTFELPDEFLRRWLKATNEKLTDEELAEGYDDFAKNLKWTLIENKIIKDNNIDIKYEDVVQAAKAKLDAQFRMYSPAPLPEDQLAQYAVQFLQEKENANRVFEEVKALKTFEQIKSIVTLEQKDIDYDKFLEMDKK
ncbi:trigger factor [Pedobacter psychrotolerans]|uniref:Trigger factor n=1 Tax=Pedobacter psychrotolerans TaxID=1843235 RepID=A0A4R2HM38_9SPHI|nr:trigger factor [Pedobacter psychrotolerans]TCO31269.1 trigger factor [Pedobacter psychrotolerans]GGE40956.1 trigger factor [Pedobacter psychrotolerans]